MKEEEEHTEDKLADDPEPNNTNPEGADDYENYETSPADKSPENNYEGDGVKPDEDVEKHIYDIKVEPDELPDPPPQPTKESPSDRENLPRANVVYRAGWGARPPKDPGPPPLHHPVESVIFLHTGTKVKECKDPLECAQVLQDLQTRNMYEDGMPDIQYNFMVTSDCTIYEGRGWFQSATKDPMYQQYDGKSLDICFIGDYSGKEVTEPMLKTALTIVGDGVTRSYLAKVVNFCPVGTTQSTPIDMGQYLRYALRP